jgi:hypothetical protein
MISRRCLSSWLIVCVDVILTYGYVIMAMTLPIGGIGPRASWIDWVTKPLTYVLILPIVMIAAWRGIHYVILAWSGQSHWFRLTVEGITIGIGGTFLLSLVTDATFLDALSGMIEAGLLAGGLGLFLTPINYGLARALHPPRT